MLLSFSQNTTEETEPASPAKNFYTPVFISHLRDFLNVGFYVEQNSDIPNSTQPICIQKQESGTQAHKHFTFTVVFNKIGDTKTLGKVLFKKLS